MRRPRVVDLFSGAGGLSLGFANAGFDVVLAIDHDEAAVQTYSRNFRHPVRQDAITVDSDLPEADVIVGGPPCQGFTSAGPRRPGDHRNSLVATFASLVQRHRPPAFLFENVEGFLTAEGGQRVLDLLRPLLDTGYRIHFQKVNVANFGVPQLRKRVIAVGRLGGTPRLPEFTHTAFGSPGASRAVSHQPLSPTLREALTGLPRASTERPGMPLDHYFSPPDGIEKERIRGLRQGQMMRDLPERLWHESYRSRAFRRVRDGTPTHKRGGAPAGLRRLVADEPCRAITGSARREFVHPTEDRFLTLRECARVQTFPDEFVFEGTVTERATQIGNAVPPVFAESLARAVAHSLRQPTNADSTGRLLSFVSTFSSGKSPALQRVEQKVMFNFHSHDPQHQRQLWD